MKKIIILARISTSPQDISSQTNDLVREATRLGYSKKNQIIIESVESAIKLSEEERLGLQKMKYYIENDNDVDCVICWEPSRLARQQKVLYSVRDYLVAHRIQLIILNPYVKLLSDDRNQIDTTANIVFSLFATISENEMSIKRERFQRAKNEMRQRGQKFGGATIFGYIKNSEKKIELHPENAKIISEIFEHYANTQDASLYSTYLWLSSQYPEKFPILPYKKAQHKIRHFFEIEVYWKGNWCYPVIVSEEIHDKVMKKMSNARSQARFETKHEWLGRGRVWCKHCGHVMVPCGGSTNAYVCPTDKEHNMTLNIPSIDWLLWEEAKTASNIMSTVDNNETILSLDRQIRENTNLVEQYNNSIREIEKRREKLLEVYINGKITQLMFDKQNDSLLVEKNQIENKKKKVDMKVVELGVLLKKSQQGLQVKPINYDSIDNFDTKLDIVKRVIDKIWCTKIENKVYELEFEYNNMITIRGHYRYASKNQFKRIWRLNEDGTEDLIYDKGTVWNKKKTEM